MSNDTVNQTAIANATFSGGNPISAGLHTWDCSGTGCQLSANTIYYIAMTVGSNTNTFSYFLWRSTSNYGETTVPNANGWSITDKYRTGWNKSLEDKRYTLMFKISATSN